MSTVTSKERILAALEHRTLDRVPIIDSPWRGTISRWKREGMPQDADWRDFFDVDKSAYIGADITPRYEVKIIEDTPRYTIATSPWGVTMKQLKEEDSTPEFLDFKVVDSEIWKDAKKRMTVDKDRVDWAYLKESYPKWQAQGHWIEGGFWFGFDVAHSWMMGTETMLVALIEEPEWAVEVFNTYLDRCIAHFDIIWDAGYKFDAITWPDDMGYKGTTFFSPSLYKELLMPVHKRAVDWAHSKGIKARLHSCGDIRTLLPYIMETGVDCLNPLEVKAGMDAVKLKKEYGDKLCLHGGVNAQMWCKRDEITEVIRNIVPTLKENGGYIFASDHSIPNDVSLENFRAIINEVKECGKY